MTQLPSMVDTFDCKGEPASVSVRWEKWKRASDIYLLASNIEKPRKKRACLLYIGGLNLQDVYYNIPGDHAEEKTDNNVYDIAVKNLDEYFSPKQSKLYERHIFRKMSQGNDEKCGKMII